MALNVYTSYLSPDAPSSHVTATASLTLNKVIGGVMILFKFDHGTTLTQVKTEVNMQWER